MGMEITVRVVIVSFIVGTYINVCSIANSAAAKGNSFSVDDRLITASKQQEHGKRVGVSLVLACRSLFYLI